MIERLVVSGIVVVVLFAVLAADLPRLIAPVAVFVGLYVLVRVVNVLLDRW